MKMASFLLRRCQFYSIAFQFHFHWKKRLVKWFAFRGDEKPKKTNKQTPKKTKNKRKAGLRRRVTPGRRPNKDARWVRRRRDADPLRGADVRTTARRAASDDDDVYFRPLFFCFLFFFVVLRVLRRSVFGRPKKILKNQVETTIFFQNEDVDEFDAHFFFISLIKNLKKRTKNDSALVPTMNRL